MPSTSHTPQLASGARAQIFVTDSSGNERLVAIATDVSVQVSDQIIPSYVCGEINPISLEPVGADASCSIGRLIPVNSSGAAASGKNAADGSAQLSASANDPATTAIELGLEDQINNILTAPALTIRVHDKIINTNIAIIKEARFAGRSQSVSSGGLATERLNFVGIYDAANGNTPEALGYGL